MEEVGTVESYAESLNLCRQVLVVGPISGFNLKGLKKFLARIISDGSINRYRNEEGEVIAVFICCDSLYPYIDEYFNYLDASNFPNVENKELLSRGRVSEKHFNTPRVLCRTLFNSVFEASLNEVWKQVKSNAPVISKNDTAIFDIREKANYEHYHIPNAINLSKNEISQNVDSLANEYKEKSVYIVCNSGNSSLEITQKLVDRGVNAFLVDGGMIERSKLNLPIVRPSECLLNHK